MVFAVYSADAASGDAAGGAHAVYAILDSIRFRYVYAVVMMMYV